MRTRNIVESINVSFDDGKITCIDDENHEGLEFGNNRETTKTSSNPDKLNADEGNSDEDACAHFQGEHVQNVVTSNRSSSDTEVTDGTSNTDGTSIIDESSNTDGASNTDDTTQTDGTSENSVENTLPGGASVENQENSFEDATDAGGASNSRQQLPPARK